MKGGSVQKPNTLFSRLEPAIGSNFLSDKSKKDHF